ncbi:MAG: hypothetical protein D3X82_16725 [Candidatus Leucobacter sulfamidivorax]|nr:hypothetical protein [Candidatus Leucobacter sulfamidivorax]
MEISVDFAAVLAQVMPVFLILLLIERIVLVEPARAYRSRAIAIGHLLRYIASMLTLLVFLSSLIIVGTGEASTGWPATAIVAMLAVLAVLLFATVHMALRTIYEKAHQQARQHPEDRPEGKHEGHA